MRINKFKAVVGSLLAATLVVSLVACGNNGIQVVEETPEPTPGIVTTEPPMIEPTPSPEPDIITENNDGEPELDAARFDLSQTYDIGNGLICDNETMKLWIGEFSATESGGLSFKLHVENRLSENNQLEIRAITINGWDFNLRWVKDLALGETAAKTFQLDLNMLESVGITKIDEITVFQTTYDGSVDDDYISVKDISYRIYPTGLDSKSIVFPEREKAEQEQVVYQSENVAYMSVLGGHMDPEVGYVVIVYIQNDTDEWLDVACTDLTVNGYEIKAFTWSRDDGLAPHTKARAEIEISKELLTECYVDDEDALPFLGFRLVMNSPDWVEDGIHVGGEYNKPGK